jgi:hypothetical protein
VRGLCRKAPRPAQLRGGRGNPAWPASGSGGAPARCRATHRWGQDLSLAPCLAGASDQQINTVACAWFGEVEEPGRYSSVRPVCRCVRIDSDRKRPRPNSAARQLPQPDAKIVFGEVSSRSPRVTRSPRRRARARLPGSQSRGPRAGIHKYGRWLWVVASPLPRLGRNDQLSGLSRENRPELQSAGAGYRVGVKTTGARSSWPDVKPAETITTSPFR